MRGGLHNHTIYSDGSYTPRYVLEKGLKDGLSYVAITDHDSVLGVLDFNDPSLIKGIELSTNINNLSIHILGFFKNGVIPKNIIDFSYNFVKNRKLRAIKMLELIQDYYKCNIDLSSFLDDDLKTVSRRNILDSLISANPNISEDVLKTYISDSSPCYIPIKSFKPEEGVKFLKDNNCLVFLAHPGRIKNEDILVDLVNNLDVDGIEVFYPTHSIDFINYLLDICNKRGLLVSGGSDFHSDTKGISPGYVFLDEPYMSNFLKALYDN